jgi:hypothetical protein
MSDDRAKDPTPSRSPEAPAAGEGSEGPARSSTEAATEAGPLATPAPKGPDVVLLGPPTADGAGVHVLRAREERLEVGELRALAEGRPIQGEIVTLAPRKDNPRICDVKESFAASPALRKGPAKVASAAYREGWDEIFGKPTADRTLN